jgi:hypothetical protein
MKLFHVTQREVSTVVENLGRATLQDTAAFIPAGQLLRRIQQASNGLKKDVVGATLRMVTGAPCAEVLPVLTELRAKMKEAKAAGDSSVGTVRAAIAALAARHGPSFPVPQWATAAEARAAQKAAEEPVTPPAGDDGITPPQASAEEVAARQAAELEELRAIADEAARLVGMVGRPLAEVLAEMRTLIPAAEQAEQAEVPTT